MIKFQQSQALNSHYESFCSIVKREAHIRRCPHFQFLTAFFFFQTVDDFRDRLETKLRENYSGVAQGVMPEGYLEAPLAYDAIWAVALGNQRIIVIFVRMRLRSSYFLSFFLLCSYVPFFSFLGYSFVIPQSRSYVQRSIEPWRCCIKTEPVLRIIITKTFISWTYSEIKWQMSTLWACR